MRKASTRLPEQGTQTPSPAPDLIPAEPKNQPRTYIAIGTANGGTSGGRRIRRGQNLFEAKERNQAVGLRTTMDAQN